ncbi:MAG: histidine phosphatase family protein [Deltaproteobacteria bacterium]|nr:histidine phosphatase family protein [Deltaproteobacteria bacterium]
MTSILLVRHAHAPWSTDEMRSLSRRGQLDADRLADELAVLPITAVYSSPYRRSLETVSPLAARLDLPVQELPDLRERALGSFNSRSFEQAVASTWADLDFAHAGGESNREARHRGISTIRFLATRHPDDVVVAGTHGNLLALILSAFDDRVAFDFWRSLKFPDVLRLDLERSGKGAYHRLSSRAVNTYKASVVKKTRR